MRKKYKSEKVVSANNDLYQLWSQYCFLLSLWGGKISAVFFPFYLIAYRTARPGSIYWKK